MSQTEPILAPEAKSTDHHNHIFDHLSIRISHFFPFKPTILTIKEIQPQRQQHIPFHSFY